MNIYLLKLISLTVFSSVFFAGCVKSDSEKMLEKTVNEVIVEQKNSNIVESDNGYLKSDGWNIPDLKSEKRVNTSKIKLKDKSGIERDVEATDYTLQYVTDEPYKFTNPNFGRIKISSFREFKIGNKTFAYVLNAQKAKYNEAERKEVGEGIVIVFSYSDNDGDGKFETLTRNSNYFVVPDWVL